MRFEDEKRRYIAALQKEKSRALQRKEIINWQRVNADWQTIYLEAEEEWRSAFIPQLQAVMEEQGNFFSTQFGFQFDVLNVRGAQWFDEYTLRFAQDINSTTIGDLTDLLQTGMVEGWSIDRTAGQIETLFQQYIAGGQDPAQWYQDRLPQARLEMIARTETIRASNFGTMEQAKEWGVETKEWLATADDRTRPSHMDAWLRYREGGTPGPIPMNQPFQVGAATLQFPGDPQGPPEETINCRCTWVPGDEDLQPEKPSGSLFDMRVNDAMAMLKDPNNENSYLADLHKRMNELSSGRSASQVQQELDSLRDEFKELHAYARAEMFSEMGMTRAEWDAYVRRTMRRMGDLQVELAENTFSSSVRSRDDFMAVLDEIDPQFSNRPFNPHFIDKSMATSRYAEANQEAFDWLTSTITDTWDGYETFLVDAADAKYTSRGAVGYARHELHSIYLGDNPRWSASNQAHIIAHESGHLLEGADRRWFERAREFLRHRAGDDPLGPTVDFPSPMAPTGWRDNFDNPYSGTVYMKNGRVMGTEIISSGMEQLFEDPWKFRATDEEYFDFIVGLLRGWL